MTTLAANLENPRKPGDEIRIQAAAVKNYRGGAAAVILGTGYATPLVPTTAGMRFIGVYGEDNDNSSGVAGTINNGGPNSGLSSWVRIFRTGLFPFNQTGLTQAAVERKAFFSDDNVISLTPSKIEAGIIVTIDEQNSVAWVDISSAVKSQTPAGLVPVTADGALSPHNSATYIVTKAGVAAMTLAAPTATVDDGIIITIVSSTANAHTLTATGLIGDGSTTTDVATFGAHPGASVSFIAYQGKWLTLYSTAITFS